MARRAARCSIGWWVGPSSPTPMESWRPDVDGRKPHQRGHPHRGPHVVAEDQEGADVGPGVTLQRDAVGDRPHRVLADAEVQGPAVGVARPRGRSGGRGEAPTAGRASWCCSSRRGRPTRPTARAARRRARPASCRRPTASPPTVPVSKTGRWTRQSSGSWPLASRSRSAARSGWVAAHSVVLLGATRRAARVPGRRRGGRGPARRRRRRRTRRRAKPRTRLVAATSSAPSC